MTGKPNHLNTYGALKLSSDIRALYPEDFGTAPFTKGQAEAVNDSILTVRRGEQLIDWICGRDYTLFLNDGAGVYSISGLNNREDGREALELENGLKVWQESADAWKWEEHVLGDFSVVVIDNYNQKEVCQKSFWIEKETCRLAE